VLLVHGLLRAQDGAVVDSVNTGAVRPRVITAGPLAAAVSEAPDHEPTADDAVAHLDLLVALVTDVPVLPMPLGTTARDDDAVRDEVLAPAVDQVEQQLAAVADLIEVRLDLAFDNDAIVSDIARTDPEIGRLVARARGAGFGERLALGEEVSARVADHQAALAETWTAELAGIAERAALLSATESLRRNTFCLRRERLADADAAVARIRQSAAGRADVEYVGPLPLYSFLDTFSAAREPEPRSRWGW
jgi:hypothetical protein